MAATGQPAATRTDRRAQIVRVAYQLVADRGLEGLRFADVARGAGINNGTLLYYFSSKDELVKAVGGLLVEEFMLVEDAASPAQDPLNVLRHEFYDARLRLNHHSAIVYTELLARAQRDASVADLLRDIDAGWRTWLNALLEQGRVRGQFRADMDADLVATTIMASIRGLGMQALVDPADTTVGPAMDAVSALIENWIVQ